MSQKTHFLLFLIFLLVILGSALGLDFINWRKGEKSYFFSFLREAPVQDNKKTMEEFLLARLSDLGKPVEPSTGFRDKNDIIHFPVSLQPDVYRTFAPILKTELQKEQITVRINHKSEEMSDIFLWELEGLAGHKAALLFKCPKVHIEPVDDTASGKHKNKVAIVVDDMGYNLNTIEELGEIGCPLTIAILPYSPRATETAEIARRYNLEVILHLPLESINDFESNKRTAGLIHAGMSEEEILATLDKNLLQVPQIRGVNNHMGSKVTTKREIMTPILARLKEKNLYFIDSVTSGRSIAFQLAREMDVPSAHRHIFLDAENNKEFILKQWKQLLLLAQRQGMAVGICHPLDTTLRILAENIHLLDKYNCEAVFASQVVK